jgi:hypothetical protein
MKLPLFSVGAIPKEGKCLTLCFLGGSFFLLCLVPLKSFENAVKLERFYLNKQEIKKDYEMHIVCTNTKGSGCEV